MTTESTAHRDDDAYRLHDVWRTHIDRNIESIEYLNKGDFRAAAAEFAVPYLARIAELETENKALRDAAKEFFGATDSLATKMGTDMQVDRYRAAKQSLMVALRGVS